MSNLIQEARELASKATQGPWRSGAYDAVCLESGFKLCNVEGRGNAAFIVRSRTLVPELADALEKAEAELAEQEKRIEFLNAIIDLNNSSCEKQHKTSNMYRNAYLKCKAELAAYKAANPPRQHGEVAWKTRQVWYANHVVENGVIVDNGKYHEDKTPYCSECGKLLDDTFMNFCPSCGCDMRKEPT